MSSLWWRNNLFGLVFGLVLMVSALVPASAPAGPVDILMRFAVRPVFGEGRITDFIENNPIVVRVSLFFLGLFFAAISARDLADGRLFFSAS